MYPMLLSTHSPDGEEVKIGGFSEESAVKEAFLLSGRDCPESVVKNGKYKGLGINEALKEVLVKEEVYSLPVYVKFLNTDSRLPVTVYPGDEYAKTHSLSSGKTSLVYITDCSENAEMVYGLSRDVSENELRRRVENGSLSAICNFVNVKKGDCFYIPEGIVFAIGAGISAVEVSSNCDSEFIISDYGRIYTGGKTRPLQINRALDVMKNKRIDIAYGNIGDITLYPFGIVRDIAQNDTFVAQEIALNGNVGFYEEEEIVSMIILSGEADASYSTGTMHIKEGDSVLLPPGVKVRLSGRTKILYTKFI